MNGYVAISTDSEVKFDSDKHFVGHKYKFPLLNMTKLSVAEFRCQIRLLQLFEVIPKGKNN